MIYYCITAVYSLVISQTYFNNPVYWKFPMTNRLKVLKMHFTVLGFTGSEFLHVYPQIPVRQRPVYNFFYCLFSNFWNLPATNCEYVTTRVTLYQCIVIWCLLLRGNSKYKNGLFAGSQFTPLKKIKLKLFVSVITIFCIVI